jgi:hypothetical protein
MNNGKDNIQSVANKKSPTMTCKKKKKKIMVDKSQQNTHPHCSRAKASQISTIRRPTPSRLHSGATATLQR